jgi:hypothetical protein
VERGEATVVEAATARRLECVPCLYHHDTKPMDYGGLKHGGSMVEGCTFSWMIADEVAEET